MIRDQRGRIFTMAMWVLFYAIGAKAQSSVSLAGQWSFRTDAAADGKTKTISLPGSTDEAGLGSYLPIYRNALGTTRPKDYPKNADFGMLTRIHKYIGPVWYQRSIVIPEKWKDQYISLYLERVLWRSEVWIDGVPVGKPIDFLSTPHVHELGIISPGRHTLTVMIDNREIYPIGILGHAYDHHTQTIWNGIIGKILLVAKPPVSLKNVRVFPSFREQQVKLDVAVMNRSGHRQTSAAGIVITEKASGKEVAKKDFEWACATGSSVHSCDIRLSHPLPWDEFTPNLYQVSVTLKTGNGQDHYTADAGFRDLGTKDKHLTVNGRKLFVRFSNESMFYPQTGYPSMELAYWRHIFGAYKAHGLNGVRFHSSCPPEAAFEAADELGLYLQVEFFWTDDWMGLPAVVGGKNDSLNNFARAEMYHALDTYGNHPSMMLVLCGNEMGGNFKKMQEWIEEEKTYDTRHYYAVSTAHGVTPADDFVEYGAKGDAAGLPNTDWNYERHFTDTSAHPYDKKFLRRDLPEYAHELGQYVVHPLWSEIGKYKGVLRPFNLEYFRQRAEQSGIADEDTSFQRASGNLNRILYKAEIEAQLRTPSNAGYSLLSMVDYPGQGEAYIGWVDVFYRDKNFITPRQFRQYGTHTVPLARLTKFVWENGEELKADIEVANYGPATLRAARVDYSFLDDDGKVLKEGRLPAQDIPQGSLTEIGSVKRIMTAGKNGRHVRLRIGIARTPYTNEWDLWIFPKTVPTAAPEDVLITDKPEEAFAALQQGRKVLFAAYKSGPVSNRRYASFAPVFWSATWFTGQETEVSGAVIRNHHPALREFPTGNVLDWQWFNLCKGAKGFVLNDLPKAYRPIIQPVDDYHFGKKLGSLFELKTAAGGKLLVCGYNITDSLAYRPAARQLRQSLLDYIRSSKFNPQQEVSREWLAKTFPDQFAPLKKPPEFKDAYLYVKAGQYDEHPNTDIPWSHQEDGVIKEEGVDYKVNAEGIWKDDGGTAWYGRHIHLEITVHAPRLMELRIRFHDWNHAGRDGTVACEDDPPVKIGKHVDGEWISFPISRENCLDGRIEVDVQTTSGPNLMITEMALLPKK